MANEIFANTGTESTKQWGVQLGPLMQGQEGTEIQFAVYALNGDAVDLSERTITGTITNNETDETAALQGALTLGDAVNEFTWTTHADDVGTPGSFKLVFVAGADLITLPVNLPIVTTPTADTTFGAALVGVTTTERAWLTAALAAVPDASGLPNPADENAKERSVWMADGEGMAAWYDIFIEQIKAYGGEEYDMLRMSSEGTLEFRTPEQVLGDIGAAALPDEETEWLTEAVDSLPDAGALQWMPNPADAPPGVSSILTSTGFGSSGWYDVLQLPNLETDSSVIPGNTRLLLWDVDTGALVRVSVGADDSGGTGYKVLRIPNG